MGSKTGIEWTDSTWNPTIGCSRVSEGCRNCYAERLAHRSAWTGRVNLAEKHLLDPLKWRTPRRVFVNSMSDLFHEGLPDAAIDRVFAVMAQCPQHTFQVLTKRPCRMAALSEYDPQPNVWLGCSVEDQKRADKHGQIDMYLFMIYLLYGIKPEDVTVHLDWVPTVRTENGDFKVDIQFVQPIEIHSFETKRTSEQVLLFASSLKKTWAEMQRFAEEYDPLES